MPGEVGDGLRQARRRRTTAEGGAKFASLRPSRLAWLTEEGEGSRAQLGTASIPVGDGRSWRKTAALCG